MSAAAQSTVAVLLITVTAVAYGGYTLLRLIHHRIPGYLDNPVRASLWRAGHAHAGVLVLFALVTVPYVDLAGFSAGLAGLVRGLLVAPPILMPLGFFLSVAKPSAERPGRLIWLVPVGAVCLAAGTLTLGIALL